MEAVALIIHPDEAWRTRLGDALSQRGLSCRMLTTWDPGISAAATQASPLVVCYMGHDGADDAGRCFDEMRLAMGDPRIVAVTQECDAAATRAAFRCGAVDCMEESAPTSLLAAGVLFALRAGETPGTPGATDTQELTVMEHCTFLDRLSRSRDECRRHGSPMSIVMLDLDRFRECNEVHSPAFGDFVLRWFADTLRSAFSGYELISRYHGDRFIVGLPGQDCDGAERMADSCRENVHARPPFWRGEAYEIGVSIGLAVSTQAFIETEHMLIRRARLALEDAKRHGANQTRTWAQLSGSTVTLARVGPNGFDQIGHWVVRTREQVRSAYHESTQALVAAAEAKELFASRHSHKVSCHAEGIARLLSLRPQMVDIIRKAAVLHDVGKIGVPDAILAKPGPLTRDEFEVIKRHPVTGVEILRHIRHLDDELPSIRHHHERFDGSGYPDALSGTDIPIGARVIAAADSIDVMFTNRTYKKPYTLEKVREELSAGAERQFDPQVVTAALRWLEDPRSVMTAGETRTEMCEN